MSAAVSPEALTAISAAVSAAFGLAEEIVHQVVTRAVQELDATPLPDAEGAMLAARREAEDRA